MYKFVRDKGRRTFVNRKIEAIKVPSEIIIGLLRDFVILTKNNSDPSNSATSGWINYSHQIQR